MKSLSTMARTDMASLWKSEVSNINNGLVEKNLECGSLTNLIYFRGEKGTLYQIGLFKNGILLITMLKYKIL